MDMLSLAQASPEALSSPFSPAPHTYLLPSWSSFTLQQPSLKDDVPEENKFLDYFLCQHQESVFHGVFQLQISVAIVYMRVPL